MEAGGGKGAGRLDGGMLHPMLLCEVAEVEKLSDQNCITVDLEVDDAKVEVDRGKGRRLDGGMLHPMLGEV